MPERLAHGRAAFDRLPGGSRWWLPVLGIGLGAGIALRVWIHRSASGVPDSDEAIVGLMTRHLLDGELSTFFWGQAYGGTQEVLLTAPVFAVADSGWVALRLVPVLLTGVAALVVWRVGRRTLGEPAATTAGLLAWIFPPFLLYKLTHQWGFYASGVLYVALILLLALRLAERPSRGRAALFGVVVGLALWQTVQVVPIVLVAAAWVAWRSPTALRHAHLAIAAGVLGALPTLVWNLQNDWGSLESPIDNTTTYAHRLRIFASPLLPMLLGLRTPFTQESLLPGPVVALLLLGLAALFVHGAYRARSSTTSLLYVVAAVFPFVYAVAPQTLFSQEPRYLVVLSPVLVLLLAQLATTAPRAAVVFALALIVSIATLDRMNTYFETVPIRPPAAPRDLGPLIATLDRLELDRVYADFWLSYRLTFETDERIVAAHSKLERVGLVNGRVLASRHPFIRYRPFEREVEAAPRRGFVFFRESLEQGADRTPGPAAEARVEQLGRLTAELERLGFRPLRSGPFVVFAPPT